MGALAFAAVSLGAGSRLGSAETVDQFSARVTSELYAKNAAAADVFKQADLARDGKQWAEAERLYRQVRALEPGFVHATRRLCHVVAAQGRRDEALSLCREAMASVASPENRSQLLAVLVDKKEGSPLTGAELSEAWAHANELLNHPQPEWVWLPSACQAAAARQDVVLLRRCVERLESLAPSEAVTHYFRWMLAASEGDFAAAHAALERARSVGLPQDVYATLKAETERARPLHQKVAPVAGVVVAVWAAGMLLLFAAGFVLSRTVLRAARQPPDVRTGESVGLTRRLRSAYQAVLLCSCVYYYLSIPVVLGVVVVGGGALVYASFVIGQVPIKLVALVVVIVLVTLFAMLKSLFVRSRDEDPGDRLEMEKHPRLRNLLDEVAAQIGTRPVDNVYMTPGTDLAVTERGGIFRQLRGRAERCLILGVAVLDGMQMGPFKAILAHEYGHFSNRDTAGGTFALAVRRSLLTMAHHLAEGGAAAWYNPAWLFLWGFNLVFLRISQGASRLQEILADRWAAFAYGAKAFEQGLRHVVERSIRFQVHASSTLQEVVDGKLPLSNLYTYQPSELPTESAILEALERQIDAVPSPYDSHPSPAERFELVRALNATGTGALEDAELDAWSVFEDAPAIQRWMTDRIRTNVAQNHGVTIPEGA
jgi:Zn-dependent protease with chaperone function